MTTGVGAVCADGHIRAVAGEFDELSGNPHCRECGKKVYQVCPNCQKAPIQGEQDITGGGVRLFAGQRVLPPLRGVVPVGTIPVG
ncbi:MAG: DUF2321 domain-containing protein [Haloferacaceae archaeon]